MTKRNVAQKVATRLLPLYTAIFLQNFVLWYAFEKIFMRSIGFNDATIGVMVAAYSFVMLVAETPSGLLADRWSRKGVLIVASITLAVASLILGLSGSVAPYIIGSLLWGVFFAMYSGTYDSIIYDTLTEEVGSSSQFDKYYGWMRIVESVALVVSSLLGAVIVDLVNIRTSYYVTGLIALLAAVSLLKFREPKLHKKEVTVPIKEQVRSTFKAIARNREVLLIVLSLMSIGLLIYITLEFSQLWYIALAAPLALYGIANAVLLTSLGFGGVLAGKMGLYKIQVLSVALVTAIVSSFALALIKDVYVAIISLTLLTTILFGLNVVFTRVLHDSLVSGIRAGASSAVSTFSRTLIIPTALLIGYLSDKFSIFTAAWVVVVLVLTITLFVILEARKDNFSSLKPRN